MGHRHGCSPPLDSIVNRPPSAETGPVPRSPAPRPPSAPTASTRDSRTACAPKIASHCMRRHGKHITVRHGFPCDGLLGIDSAATDSQARQYHEDKGRRRRTPGSAGSGGRRTAHGSSEGPAAVPTKGTGDWIADLTEPRKPRRADPRPRGAPGPARGFVSAFGFCRFTMKGVGPFSAVCPGFRVNGAGGGRGSPFRRSERTGPPGRFSPAGWVAPRSRT